MRWSRTFSLAIVLFGSPSAAVADDLFASLDNVCGAVLKNNECLTMLGEFPEAMGGAVGILEINKSSMNSSAECKSKLLVGTPPLSDALKYFKVPGIPSDVVPKVVQCSCEIVYSTASCSGEAQKALDTAQKVISGALATLDSWFGSDIPNAPPAESHEQQKDRYYKTLYVPLLDPMTFATSDVLSGTFHQVNQQCEDDWWNIPWVSDTGYEICGPFYRRFMAELKPRWDAIQKAKDAAAKAKADELQKKADAEQKAKDKLTDNARKVALSWAKIKHDVYAKQCHDVPCVNDVTVLAFFYYGEIATGMQKPNSSNTQVLSQANAKFEPLFKQKVAEAQNRKVVKQTDAQKKIALHLAPTTARLAKSAALKSEIYAKLKAAGIKKPEQALLRARYLRFHKVAFAAPSAK